MPEASLLSESPRVSIVAPVYNVEPYIREFLESICNQDIEGAIEVILVDDASTDASNAICREYVDRYPQHFSLIEAGENSGVSVARNLGLDRARGFYLMFVDPDDVLPPDALSSMVEAADRYEADIVKGNLVLFDETSRRRAPDHVDTTRLLEGEDVLTALYLHRSVRGHVGGKLFRRDRFGDLRLPVGVRMAQDLLYFSELFARARSLLLLNHEVYLYRKHLSGSTGRKYAKGSYVDWMGAVEAAGGFAKNDRQKRAHKDLLLRTLTQIARESRDLEKPYAETVLSEIERRRVSWKLRLPELLFRDKLGPRSLARYCKLCLALGRVRRNLARS